MGFTIVFFFIIITYVWPPSLSAIWYLGFCLFFSSLFGRWVPSNPDRSVVTFLPKAILGEATRKGLSLIYRFKTKSPLARYISQLVVWRPLST